MRAVFGVLTVTAIYFFIIWLTAIRRGGQQVTLWIVQVLMQGVSVYLFIMLGRASAAWIIILGVNILFIIAANLLRVGKQKPAPAAVQTAAVMDLGEIEDFAPGREIREMGMADAERAPAAPSASEGDENRMFDMIRKLVDGGQQEDAVKYLRMVAFYEKDPAVAEKAKALLAQLQS